MDEHAAINPAERAAELAQTSVHDCLKQGKSFLLEAGAGAGKTYSLIEALKHLIDQQGRDLLRRNQQIACITYTNVATNEIKSRTDGHPAVISSTIHAFCWSLIKDFQPLLRKAVPLIPKWDEKLAEVGGLGSRRVDYELGYRIVEEDRVLLGHDDVLSLTVVLMEQTKFRTLVTARYPILFIDEYQDTNEKIAQALKTHFLGKGPLIGFFGDHWQKIYGDGCGKIEDANLHVIGKGANFRSAAVIVEALNQIRPELKQAVTDPGSHGSVAVYHTNQWAGERRTGPHWKGDLPPEVAHAYLNELKKRLAAEGWDFSPQQTKILMLTHNVLAKEQGYSEIAAVFQGNNERFIKKEDRHIEFLVDTLEPVCTAYENKKFGAMFEALGGGTPTIQSHTDKARWAADMNKLLELRSTGTIGAVLDHLKQTGRPRIPDAVERRERRIGQPAESLEPNEQTSVERLIKLRAVPYQEVIALARFIEEKTPFSTKHGVKGAEFENVLVVFGRGWNQYDFNEMLEWVATGIPAGKQTTFERNRNLFYVACSRPRKRLSLLFTQKLSAQAIGTLSNWFGAANIIAGQIPGGQ